jgi:hypothetical protein
MTLRRTLPALLLALALTGCGDDEDPKDSDSSKTTQDPRAAQAEALLECTTEKGLPGTIGQIEGGIPAIDLTTENETIVVHLLESEAKAASYQNQGDFDQEQADNAVILGGAISPEHRAVIVECIEANPVTR